MITTLSSREFNQDTARAKRAAAQGPVVITDRGEPSHVLLSIGEYRNLTARRGTIIELLGQPDGIADIEFDLPDRKEYPREIDFD